MKAKMTGAALLACALAGTTATATFADGENVDTTVKVRLTRTNSTVGEEIVRAS